MLRELLKNRKLNNLIKKFSIKHKDKVLDIILFGSALKGGEKPNDIDIILLFSRKEDTDIAYELKKSLRDINPLFSITTINYKGLLEGHTILNESIFSEGYSLIYKKPIAAAFGFTSNFLVKYELRGFSKSERMRFYYSFYGRGGAKGISSLLNLKKFSETLIICPPENLKKLEEYLKNWNIKFNVTPVLAPSRLS